jgi:hypothetical protein
LEMFVGCPKKWQVTGRAWRKMGIGAVSARNRS